MMLVLILVLLGGFSDSLLAQGSWRTQEMCDCVPVTIAFDELARGHAITSRRNGLWPIDFGKTHWRENPDGSWRKVADSVFEWTFASGQLVQHFAARSYDRLLFAHSNNVFESTNSGKTWRGVSGGAGVKSLKMFSADSGYKVATNFSDSTVSVFASFGENIGFFDRIIDHQMRHPLPHDIRVLSPDSLLMLSSTLLTITTDRGLNWVTRDPFLGTDSTANKQLAQLSLTTDPARFYILDGYYKNTDYFYTSNFGVSWNHFKGRFNSRLGRLVESSQDLLWGVVMDSVGWSSAESLFGGFTGTGRRCTGDTLIFSTDRGYSWHKEQRFIGDTISHLIAGDSGRVYVMHYRNGHTYISTFTPGASSVDVISAKHSTLKVYPNPSSNAIKFTLPVDGNVHVRFVNVLGQPLYDVDLQHDASRESVIEYPESMRAISGPILMVVETPWYRIGQLVIKQ